MKALEYESDMDLVAVSLKLTQRLPHELPPNIMYLLRHWLQSGEVQQVCMCVCVRGGGDWCASDVQAC